MTLFQLANFPFFLLENRIDAEENVGGETMGELCILHRELKAKIISFGKSESDLNIVSEWRQMERTQSASATSSATAQVDLQQLADAKNPTLWRAKTDKISGRVYFYNKSTKDTSWTKPECLTLKNRNSISSKIATASAHPAQALVGKCLCG